jgi:hypothetical protein
VAQSVREVLEGSRRPRYVAPNAAAVVISPNVVEAIGSSEGNL